MKTLEQLLNQEPVFLNDFTCKQDVIDHFENVYNPETVNIIYADYEYENYEGSAIVLFEQDGQLYEVHGSHCSCYGLEGQWEPEATTLEALKFRNENGSGFYPQFKECLGL